MHGAVCTAARRLPQMVYLFALTQSLDRRTFLGSITAPVAALSLARALFAQHAPGNPDWASLGMGLSTGIASELVKSKFGPIGGVVFGSVLSALGLGDDTSAKLDQISAKLDEIDAKLDQVISQLNVLQSSVDAVRDQLRESTARIDYDTAYGRVQELISHNQTLLEMYRDIVDPSKRDAIAFNKQQFLQQVGDGVIVRGVRQLWNDSIQGLNGQTGLIEAFCRKVWSSPRAFTAADAHSIEQHWDFLDAQQSLSIMFLMEYYNAHGAGSNVPDLLKKWEASRRQQLTRLRGTLRAYDVFPILSRDPDDGRPPIRDGKTQYHVQNLAWRMPAGVLVSKNPPVFWYTKIFPARTIHSFQEITGWINEIFIEVTKTTGLKGWYIPLESTFLEMLKEVGPSMPGHMVLNGFQTTGDASQILLLKAYGDPTVEAYSGYFGIKAPPINDTACLLLAHDAQPNETCWYQ